MKKESEDHGTDAELLWVYLSETASSECNGGRFALAVRNWHKAYEIARDFEEHDPRVACSLNNVAVGLRTNGKLEAAEKCYGRALEEWRTASQWVNAMHLTQRARSSLFHMRMEQKHRSQYRSIAVERFNKLLPAGSASTHNNLAELFCITERPGDAKNLYVKALAERTGALGESDSGRAIIRRNMARLSDMNPTDIDQKDYIPSQLPSKTPLFGSQATIRGWIVGKPAHFTDEGRLMAAILLSYLIDHSRL